MNYKYKTHFDFQVEACNQNEDKFVLSEANIENLKPLIPESVDLKKNIDLFGVAFNAAVVNEFNKNGDGISTATAVSTVDQFIHKPTNIEHDKKKIVGHIVSAGFSDLSNSNILAEIGEENNDAFNICLGAVIYKTIDKEFFQKLEASTDPNNELYKRISASWEIGFSEYQIAVGSKNLKEAEIITDEKKITELKGFLRGFGGKGLMDDGTEIYRLIVGDIYPLGIGFTLQPAANVQGVTSAEDKKSLAIDISGFKKISDKISQSKSNDVNKYKIMDELEKLLSELKESLAEKKLSQEAIAGMTSTFADKIKEKDKEYQESLEAAEKEKESIKKANEELKSSVDEVKKELAKAQEKLEEFEKEKAQAEAVELFNQRMGEIDSIYELSEADNSFIAEKIKNLDSSQSAFDEFKKELSYFWASKNKEKIEAQKKEIQAKIDEEVQKRIDSNKQEESKASKDDLENAFDKSEKTNGEIPNNNESQASDPESMREKFKEAFSRENILEK
jgi:hypothetical protein